MTVAVRYFSKSGNTRKVAEAIASGAGVTALDVTSPLEAPVDLLFLGCALYAGGIDPAVKQFLADNKDKISRVVCVSTTAVAKSARKALAKAAASVGVTLADEEFACRGAFGPVHKNRPNDEDLTAAKTFAKAVCIRMGGDKA